MTNLSEVARLRQRITAEYEAAEAALTAVAVVARHDFIQKRLEMVATLHQQLIQEVGQEEAITIIANIAWPARQK